jgi:hypothetical protein
MIRVIVSNTAADGTGADADDDAADADIINTVLLIRNFICFYISIEN